ncbi:hypothetical protein FHU33_1749 [Blastococcus colisei]|uniref:Uncharacterized protein n=1 Tax=Blastococcus colisei TaxID=1564162 RepID=A0A543PE41_9ACTN|nr:hypothetical protein [Blastococcus colisei]TQN42352.1 hypothetical protein FHU33_1749 [Blastococcus colisei]
METAFATPATAPFPLVDLDDLHDADLDDVVAEQLSEAVATAKELADLAVRPGHGALSAHALRAHVLLLAVF